MPTQPTRQPAAPDAPPGPGPGPGPVTAFVQPLGIGLLVALAFVLTYLTALHQPQPHHLPVGVLAPPGVVAQLQRTLSIQAGDAVALRPATDVTAARHQLERGQLVAAYLPGQGPGRGQSQGGPLLVAGALIAGPLLGVLPGPLVALVGVLVLVGLATALATLSLTALLGDAGIVVATLLLVILGNATSGGVASASFLPGGFRQPSPALPAGAAIKALGRVDYFDAGAALGPVAVLAAWALDALLLLLVAVRGRRRARPVTTLAERVGVTS